MTDGGREREVERPSRQVLNKLCLSTSNMLVKQGEGGMQIGFPPSISPCEISCYDTLHPRFPYLGWTSEKKEGDDDDIWPRCQIRLYFSHLSMQRRVAPFVEIALLSRAADVLILEMDT